ncbi:MAG: phosphate signaling complex protein PhoU [Clostridiales bacterium]|nr:phosphate signaling complex protein PhoU [Clostridiales bacterium]
MRNKFDQQLMLLNQELTEMGALCEEAIEVSVQVLLDVQGKWTRGAAEIETSIDEKEREIESLCMKLLLQQQPVARDLRQISSALKMITDMERIGDQAADIYEIMDTSKLALTDDTARIGRMAKAASKMVTDSVNAFVDRDTELARAVIRYDDVVDGLFDEVKWMLMKLISQDMGSAEYAMDLLMIAKYLERIGDHAVNIAEWVIFSITGVHKGERELTDDQMVHDTLHR